MISSEDVCVLIPTRNEAPTIGSVIDGFLDQGFENILVIDGGSTDGTRAIVRERGARLIQQSGRGKGRAVREAVTEIEAPFVLMMDGDGTYRPEDAEAMLEPLVAGEAEHVIGNRFADLRPGAMSGLHRFGNRVMNGMFRFVHGIDLVDILSGYRAFTRDSFTKLYLTAEGFDIETELSVECIRRDIPVAIVPVTYRPRPAESEANLQSFRHGTLILTTLYRLAKTTNPLFYFGSAGGLIGSFGLIIGTYVGYEWISQGISHDVLALVASFGIIFGIQLLMFGILSDMLLALHREQLRANDDSGTE